MICGQNQPPRLPCFIGLPCSGHCGASAVAVAGPPRPAPGCAPICSSLSRAAPSLVRTSIPDVPRRVNRMSLYPRQPNLTLTLAGASEKVGGAAGSNAGALWPLDVIVLVFSVTFQILSVQ